MTVSSKHLLDVLSAPRTASGEQYEVRASLPVGFLGRAPDGAAAFLVELREEPQAINRTFGRVTLRFEATRFDVGGRQWDGPAAIIATDDQALLPTFVALCCDASARFAAPFPSGRDVVQLLTEWENLFRRSRDLGSEEELGLWGELQIILLSATPSRAVEAWVGPSDAPADFHGGGISLECKTSFLELAHHCSMEQVDRPYGDDPAYLASLWAGEDATAGTSLPEAVDAVVAMLDDPSEFERKLLRARYSRADASLYTRRLRLLQPPMLFPVGAVPRIRAVDPGVSNVRYVARLDPDMALQDQDARTFIANLGLPQAAPRGPR